MKVSRGIFTIASAIIIGVTIGLFIREEMPEHKQIEVAPYRDTSLFCALSIKEHDDTTSSLIVGYCYAMMKAFATVDTLDMDIRVVPDSLSWVDSLKQGRWDMVVIPIEDAVERDSILYSQPLDSIAVCAAGLHRQDIIEGVNEWLPFMYERKNHARNVNIFMHPYNPVLKAERGKTVSYISPYDDIIKKYAGNLGWDWRMLAALIFQESHFNINAGSTRGAHGLMQVMPATARQYKIENTLDPEDCIRGGVELLGSLQRFFSGKADNPVELHKMALAAYNAGPGRIQDCINLANFLHKPSKTWDDLLNVIPQMNEDSIMEIDTVKCGKFKGGETVAFVDNIMSLYETFCTICPNADSTAAPFGLLDLVTEPEQSEQDQPEQ
ncbi:MAG: transglycosylase SLT domain-containing protein [Bacteroidales bacterium]|nr:transglycosylase SLT domain-containing protein [Bacteroidales bacterium]